MNDLTVGALTTQRQSFGVAETQAGSIDTSAVAFAAEAKALIEARFIMALRRPRVWDQVRQDIMKECRRPSFADNPSAYYHKPIGKGVEGLGIRFVEMAMRCMTNVSVESRMKSEDELKEVHQLSVTDLEGGAYWSQDVRVSKTVERSKPADDGSYISVRRNSWGKETFTVPATDDDLLNKRAALISKAMRTVGLRLIPGDIQDEAKATILRVREDKAAQDPDGERKSIVDAFGGINVRAADLIEYVGCPLDQCSPAQLVQLRGIFGAIREGETTWRAVVDAKAEANGTPPAPPAPSGPQRRGKGKADAKKDEKEGGTPKPADAPPAASDTEGASAAPNGALTAATPATHQADQSSRPSQYRATEGEKAWLVRQAREANVGMEELCDEAGITDFENLTPDGFIALREKLDELKKKG